MAAVAAATASKQPVKGLQRQAKGFQGVTKKSLTQQHALCEGQQRHPCVTVDKDKERGVFPRAIVK